MKAKPWAKLPTGWVRDGTIRSFAWRTDGSGGTAALMIFYALCQFAYTRPLRRDEKPPPSSSGSTTESHPETQASNIAEPSNPPALPLQLAYLPTAPAVTTVQSPMPPWLHRISESQKMAPSPPWSEHLSATVHKVVPNISILNLGSPGTSWDADVTVEGRTVAVEGAPEENDVTLARLTYVDINALTGLSKKLTSAGIKLLIEREMIWRVDQAGTYGILGLGPGENWAKLPGLALMSKGQTSFSPFGHFFMRSKHELNALKVYFYYAATRDRAKPYSEPAFERIFEKTGVAERDIATANSLLISSGFLARTRPVPSDDTKRFESNHYYMTGYGHLFIPKKK